MRQVAVIMPDSNTQTESQRHRITEKISTRTPDTPLRGGASSLILRR